MCFDFWCYFWYELFVKFGFFGGEFVYVGCYLYEFCKMLFVFVLKKFGKVLEFVFDLLEGCCVVLGKFDFFLLFCWYMCFFDLLRVYIVSYLFIVIVIFCYSDGYVLFLCIDILCFWVMIWWLYICCWWEGNFVCCKDCWLSVYFCKSFGFLLF